MRRFSGKTDVDGLLYINEIDCIRYTQLHTNGTVSFLLKKEYLDIIRQPIDTLFWTSSHSPNGSLIENIEKIWTVSDFKCTIYEDIHMMPSFVELRITCKSDIHIADKSDIRDLKINMLV